MIRRAVLVSSAALLALTSVGVQAAGATVPPVPSGSISCTLSGSAAIKPPLTNHAPPKAPKFKLAGVLSACDNSGVSGGKLPITDGTFKASASGAVSCANPFSFLSTTGKAVIKWQGTNPQTGKLQTVATTQIFFAISALTIGTPVSIALSDTTPIAKGAFADDDATINLVLDQVLGDLLGCAAGSEPLSSLDFTGVNGDSTIALS